MCSRPNTAPAPLARARARCRGSPGLDPVQARPVWKVIGRAQAMSCAPADGTMLTMNPHFVPLVRGRRLQITAYIVPGHGCVCMQSSSWGQSLPPQNGGGAALPTGQQPPLSTVWTPCGCSATASSHMSPPHDNRSQFGEKVRWRPSRTCFYMSVCFPMLKEAHQQRAYVLSSICEPCAAHRIAFLPEAPGRIVQ